MAPRVVAVYSNRAVADAVRAMLVAHGIPTELLADDAAGLSPDLAVQEGVRLLVGEGDVTRARALLDEWQAEEPAGSPSRRESGLRGLAGLLAVVAVLVVIASVIQNLL